MKTISVAAMAILLASIAHAENAQQGDVTAQQQLWLRAERVTAGVSQAGVGQRGANGVTSLNAVEMLCFAQLTTYAQRTADTTHGLIFVLAANTLVASPEDRETTRKIIVAELTPALHTLSDEQAAVTNMAASCASTGPLATQSQAVSGLLSDAISQLTALEGRLGPATP
jgi:hypothetical protein